MRFSGRQKAGFPKGRCSQAFRSYFRLLGTPAKSMMQLRLRDGWQKMQRCTLTQLAPVG
jgi:hypothetical protein